MEKAPGRSTSFTSLRSVLHPGLVAVLTPLRSLRRPGWIERPAPFIPARIGYFHDPQTTDGQFFIWVDWKGPRSRRTRTSQAPQRTVQRARSAASPGSRECGGFLRLHCKSSISYRRYHLAELILPTVLDCFSAASTSLPPNDSGETACCIALSVMRSWPLVERTSSSSGQGCIFSPSK